VYALVAGEVAADDDQVRALAVLELEVARDGPVVADEPEGVGVRVAGRQSEPAVELSRRRPGSAARPWLASPLCPRLS